MRWIIFRRIFLFVNILMANLKEHIEDIIKFLRSIEFQIDPIPNVKIDNTENDPDDIFIKTGFECPYLLQLLIVLRDLSAVFPDQFFIDTALIDTG